jgi:hypothetical protein
MRYVRHVGHAVGLALLAILLSQPIGWALQSVDNYFEQAVGTDNALVLDGTWRVDSIAVTATGAELNKTTGVDANAWPVLSESFLITEAAAAAGSATYTAEAVLPANTTILDVQVYGEALWDDGAGATMDCGDTEDPNGIYAAVDLVATDLLAGEALTFEHPGGKAGADLTAEQRDFYRAAGTTVSCVVTVTTGDGTLGRTSVVILYNGATQQAVTFVDP